MDREDWEHFNINPAFIDWLESIGATDIEVGALRESIAWSHGQARYEIGVASYDHDWLVVADVKATGDNLTSS